MKKLKNMEIILGIGVLFIFLSGFILSFNNTFNYNIRFICISTLALILYICSFIFKSSLNIKSSHKLSLILGNLTLIYAFFIAGIGSVFGNFFSLNGDGVKLFLASIALLIAILAILTKVITKNNIYIYISIVSFYIMFYYILTYFNLSYQILLIIISCTYLIANILNKKINKIIFYLFLIVSSIFGLNDNIYLSVSLLTINNISLILNIKNNNSLLFSIISLILYGFSIIMFMFNINASNIYLCVILIAILCLFSILINYFKVYENNVNISYNCLDLFFSIIIILFATIHANYFASLYIAGFVLLTSYINSSLLKRNNICEYFFPIKLCLFIYMVYLLNNHIYFNIKYLFYIPVVYLHLFNALILLIMFKFSKHKGMYLACSIISLLLVFTPSNALTIKSFSALAIIILLYYLVISYKKYNSENNAFYTFLIVLLLISADMYLESICLLILIILSGVLLYLNKDNKYNYIITVFSLLYFIYNYFDTIFDADALIIFYSLACLILVLISSLVIFKKDKKTINNISFITLIANNIVLIDYADSFLIIAYGLIISLIAILLTFNKVEYKSAYITGLVSLIIFLLKLIFYKELPVAIYLFILGLLVIIFVSFKIKKYNHNSELKYCPNCGAKKDGNDNFCGNCGNKF